MNNIGYLLLGIFIGIGLTLLYSSSSKSFSSNTEVWEWIDYKGRRRRMVVTRRLH